MWARFQPVLPRCSGTSPEVPSHPGPPCLLPHPGLQNLGLLELLVSLATPAGEFAIGTILGLQGNHPVLAPGKPPPSLLSLQPGCFPDWRAGEGAPRPGPAGRLELPPAPLGGSRAAMPGQEDTDFHLDVSSGATLGAWGGHGACGVP